MTGQIVICVAYTSEGNSYLRLKVIWVCIGFAPLHSMIGYEIFLQPPEPIKYKSETNQSLITHLLFRAFSDLFLMLHFFLAFMTLDGKVCCMCSLADFCNPYNMS